MTIIDNKIINFIISNGGATINKYGNLVKMKSGYQVSRRDLYILPVNELNISTLQAAIDLLQKRGEYLGIWIDSGNAYIDISVRISTKQNAIIKGKELNQLSILRWRDCECLAVE